MGLRSEDLPPAALDSILSWRLGQYLLTGFYDPEVIAGARMTAEPSDLVSDRDVHGLAVDVHGDLAAYLSVKQPQSSTAGLLYGDSNRPSFPCEEVHGRAWQKNMTGAGRVDLLAVRELARFVKDQRRPDDPVCLRAPFELGLATARLARHPRFQEAVRLVTGDLDPEVALDCPDEEALTRLLALRQFVRVKESSLKRPLSPPEHSVYPVDALAAASSRDVSLATLRPLRWAGTIAACEYAARRLLSSRATALLIAYAGLAVAAASTGSTAGGGVRRRVPAGAVALALGGYPLGRAVARDASPGPPPEGIVRELVVLGVVVPVAEELVWGGSWRTTWECCRQACCSPSSTE